MKIMKNWLRELVFTRPSYIWDPIFTESNKKFNRFKVAVKLGYIALTIRDFKTYKLYSISYNDEKIKEFLLNYYSFPKKLG